jgi:hypothetical protein
VTKPALRVSQAAPRPYNWTPGRVKSARQADTLTPLRLTRAVIGVPVRHSRRLVPDVLRTLQDYLKCMRPGSAPGSSEGAATE